MSKILQKRVTPILDWVYYDNEIMHYSEAQIGLGANSLQYGINVFGGIRGFVNEQGQIHVFALEKHHKRLMDSCKIMAFDYHISYEEFSQIIFKLINKNEIKENFYIRPFIFCDESVTGPKLHLLNFELAVYIQTLNNYIENKNGLKLLTSSFVKYSDNAISTKSKVGGSYNNSLLAYHQAHVSGCDDALIFNQNGYLAEASVANVIVVKDDQILVPHTSDGALEGITLRTCLQLFDYYNIKYQRTHIDRSTLYSSDEILLCGTAMKIGFTSIVDGRKISEKIGPIGLMLQTNYQQILDNKHELSKQLLTKVPCQD